MEVSVWVMCPKCGKKTHTKLREDTLLTNFPLYCPKCKRESLISANEFKVQTIKEDRSESQTQYGISPHTRRASALIYKSSSLALFLFTAINGVEQGFNQQLLPFIAVFI